MELSCQLSLRRAAMRANWIPRLQNEEADALTNSDFRHFDAAKRVQVDLEELPFKILNDLFTEGEAYVAELEELKKREKRLEAPHAVAPNGRKRKAKALREKDPW